MIYIGFEGLRGTNFHYKPAVPKDKSVKTSVCCLLKNLPANLHLWKKFQGDNTKLLSWHKGIPAGKEGYQEAYFYWWHRLLEEM